MISLSHVTTTFAPASKKKSWTSWLNPLAKLRNTAKNGGNVETKQPEHNDAPVAAVNDVSLNIAQGEIHGIIGFSGAGKSTLLRNINLLQRPTSGEVWVDGEDLTTLSAEELRIRRHHIGMIFQGFNLVNNLTTLQNVELSLKFSGVDADERRTRALEALELVDMATRADYYPAQLSGGQKQRAAIARAIATRPKILLCDEPTSALDPMTTGSVLQYLADLNRELGITVVVVTHEMDVISALADNVSVMENGEIVERFAVADLHAGTFTPATRIGQFLTEDTLHVVKEPVVSKAKPNTEREQTQEYDQHVAFESEQTRELSKVGV